MYFLLMLNLKKITYFLLKIFIKFIKKYIFEQYIKLTIIVDPELFRIPVLKKNLYSPPITYQNMFLLNIFKRYKFFFII